MIVGLLTIIGAINWGLIGLFDFNLVETLFSTLPQVQKAVYILIGLSGVLFAGFEATEQKYF